MYRVALTAGLATALAGCSLGSSSISSGFVENPQPTTAAISRPTAKSVGLGGEPAIPRGVQLAKLDDRAPAGTFEKAPAGILSDRDYSKTMLDAQMARDIIKQQKLDGDASVIEGNLLDVDLSKADVVTLYLLTESNSRLKPNLERYLKPGARVVSHDFEIKGWKPVRVEEVQAHRRNHKIYVYVR